MFGSSLAIEDDECCKSHSQRPVNYLPFRGVFGVLHSTMRLSSDMMRGALCCSCFCTTAGLAPSASRCGNDTALPRTHEPKHRPRRSPIEPIKVERLRLLNSRSPIGLDIATLTFGVAEELAILQK